MQIKWLLLETRHGEIEEIQGFGKPATFSLSLPMMGRHSYGEAPLVFYRHSYCQLVADRLIMTKNAMLSQDGSIIRGSKITYQIGSQKLVADSGENNRVSPIQPTEVNK